MNAAGNENDSLTPGYQFPRLLATHIWWSEFAWVSKQLLDTLVFFQPRQVLGRANGGHDEGFIHRRLPESLELNAVAGYVELVEVIKQLVPARELTVIARNKTKHIFRSRDAHPQGGLQQLTLQ